MSSIRGVVTELLLRQFVNEVGDYEALKVLRSL